MSAYSKAYNELSSATRELIKLDPQASKRTKYARQDYLKRAYDIHYPVHPLTWGGKLGKLYTTVMMAYVGGPLAKAYDAIHTAQQLTMRRGV